MKHFCILFISFIFSQAVSAQEPVQLPPSVSPTDTSDKVFSMVEQEAEFPGGLEAWKKYITKNLNANVAINRGAPSGIYRVIVRFVVEKDGSISDVKAESNNGFGTETEAISVIVKGPKWNPAKQNGRNVRAYHRQPITFVVR